MAASSARKLSALIIPAADLEAHLRTSRECSSIPYRAFKAAMRYLPWKNP